MMNFNEYSIYIDNPAPASDLYACRVCLATDTKLFGLAENFEAVLGLHVQQGDGLPQHLCHYCFMLVQKYSSFRDKCSRSQSILQAAVRLNKTISTEYLRLIDRDAENLALPLSIHDTGFIDYEIVEAESNQTNLENTKKEHLEERLTQMDSKDDVIIVKEEMLEIEEESQDTQHQHKKTNEESLNTRQDNDASFDDDVIIVEEEMLEIEEESQDTQHQYKEIKEEIRDTQHQDNDDSFDDDVIIVKEEMLEIEEESRDAKHQHKNIKEMSQDTQHQYKKIKEENQDTQHQDNDHSFDNDVVIVKEEMLEIEEESQDTKRQHKKTKRESKDAQHQDIDNTVVYEEEDSQVESYEQDLCASSGHYYLGHAPALMELDSCTVVGGPRAPPHRAHPGEPDVDALALSHAELIAQAETWERASVSPLKPKKGNPNPNHIKRPMNAFMVWAQIQRRQICQETPDVHSAQLSIDLGKAWRALDVAQRQPFIEQAEWLKQLHMREYPHYKYRPRQRKRKKHAPANQLRQAQPAGSLQCYKPVTRKLHLNDITL